MFLEKKKENDEFIDDLKQNNKKVSRRKSVLSNRDPDEEETIKLDTRRKSSRHKNESTDDESNADMEEESKEEEEEEEVNGEEEDEDQDQEEEEENNENIDTNKMRKRRTKENLNEYLEDYFDVVCSCQLKGRYIANIFYLLPSKEDYPDYYEIIKVPIDLRQIANKILKSSYKTLEQMHNDLIKMTKNAKKYNDPKSQIYQDANYLRKFLIDTKNDIQLAISSNRPFNNTKTREKKHRIVEEIAQMQSYELTDPQINGKAESSEHINSNINDEDDAYGGIGGESNLNESFGTENSSDELWNLYSYMKDFKVANQTIIDPFMRLPNRKYYPDYYEEIKQPIALNHIKANLNKNRYNNIKELAKDFQLMFNNAMHYNIEDSQIYKDAKTLLQALSVKIGELDGQVIKKQSPIKPNNSLKQNLDYLFNSLVEYCDEKSGEILSEKFYSSSTPDSALDLEVISNNISIDKYKTELEMVNDCLKVFDSAKNDMDAQILRKFLLKISKKFLPQLKQENYEIDSSGSYPKYDPKYANLDLKDKLMLLYTTVTDYVDEKDKRELAPPFKTLPSKIEYPDYYNIIKKPIDLGKIHHKIVTHAYNCVEDMISDFVQLFENACTYNEPGSLIYTDAIKLQKILFFKRSEIEPEDVVCDVRKQVQDLLCSLFNAVNTYNDSEGRVLSDSFVILLNDEYSNDMLNFFQIKKNLDSGIYRRLDTLQSDFFTMFDRVKRTFDRKTQIYRDALDLQTYFIKKRDELFKNGDLLNSNAFMIKVSMFEEDKALSLSSNSAQDSIINSLLRVDYLNNLKKEIIQESTKSLGELNTGDYIYFKLNDSTNKIGQICDIDSKSGKFIVQIFLQSHEIDTNCVKFFHNEVFKSDLYEVIDSSQVILDKKCFIISLHDYLEFEIKPKHDNFTLYVVESVYSTELKVLRKVKKLASVIKYCPNNNFDAIQRPNAITVLREYPSNDTIVHKLLEKSKNLNLKEPQLFIQTVQLTQSSDNPDGTLFEQIYVNSICYKLGDYLYVKKYNSKNQPLIMRIDKIWLDKNKINENDHLIKGAVFLYPYEIPHEPARLFYSNEIFQVDVKEETIGLDEIIGKCVVMNTKKYQNSRHTEIDEKDVYVCELKYVPEKNLLRKFNRGLKKYDLSSKCYEDEIFYFKKELRIRKYLSPSLISSISKKESSEDILQQNIDIIDDNTTSNSIISNDAHVSSPMKIDRPVHSKLQKLINGDQSVSLLNSSSQSNLSLKSNEKKTPARRGKKCGYNLFSKEACKKLRAVNPELSFTDMSREVGVLWKALTDAERAAYEEKAREEYRREQAELGIVDEPKSVKLNKHTSQTPVATITTANSTINNHINTNCVNSQSQIIIEKPITADTNEPVNKLSHFVHYQTKSYKQAHTNAYTKYIDSLKRNDLTKTNYISDWQSSLNLKPPQLRHSNTKPVPSNWIENVNSTNVFKHLLSLRYYLLNDAVNIQKYENIDVNLVEENDEEMVI